MSNRKHMDLTGQRFGRLVVVESEEPKYKSNGQKIYRWVCVCDCGEKVVCSTQSLRSGHTQSCGCLQRERANFLDISGRKYGKLTVIKIFGKNKHNEIIWLCKCDCGNLVKVSGTKLKIGHTKSCGCIKRGRKKSENHSYSCRKRIYNIWTGMKVRCFNPNAANYKYYGGRGISVCEEWKNDFQSFYDWAVNNGYADNLTIDREDNDKGYSPDNCRWVSMKEQARNTHQAKTLTYNGETKTISEWSDITGIRKETIKRRIKNGWSIERCIETPSKRTLKTE